ncbi:cellulose binding domain-containing protein [Solwaraspora sp. WMMD791]|uniref:cellulose binding domain-containing protein n=1 Tax=Solwaraspora sp. WMMD791 TaxID=3016086 RepID=UPI00249C38A6|nr:cellulose binding domain-containing protein [Solwaraspora sp. WMMD791]WFE29449.1 cellulose binding domain-containing protein [Solwaraspora sp. WMMD791]
MNGSRSSWARVGTLTVALLIGAATVGFAPTAAHAAIAHFVKESEWSDGYVGKLTVHNNAPVPITSWRVDLELPAGTSISSHWNAELTRVGTRYVFQDLGWNGTLAAGATTSFGWIASGVGSPVHCLVDNQPCAPDDDGTGPDVDPPTIPANPRHTFENQQLNLRWDASTDNRGVVGYDIFSHSGQLATTTGTSHTMPPPPPGVFVFGVRAVDAAGNSSPFAIITIGDVPDDEPPTAPSRLRLTGPRDGHYQITWDPSDDNVLVAGYEVQQMGTVSAVTLVGDTFAYGESRGYGTYLFRVRAFDSAGNFSAPVHVGIAVDPAPSIPPTPPTP